MLRQLLLWLPNVVVAVAVLIIGGLAANALAGLIRGATAKTDLGNPDLLANIARVAVWAFAIVVAVNQIGIARELVNTLFMATVGAVPSRRASPLVWEAEKRRPRCGGTGTTAAAALRPMSGTQLKVFAAMLRAKCADTSRHLYGRHDGSLIRCAAGQPYLLRSSISC